MLCIPVVYYMYYCFLRYLYLHLLYITVVIYCRQPQTVAMCAGGKVANNKREMQNWRFFDRRFSVGPCVRTPDLRLQMINKYLPLWQEICKDDFIFVGKYAYIFRSQWVVCTKDRYDHGNGVLFVSHQYFLLKKKVEKKNPAPPPFFPPSPFSLRSRTHPVVAAYLMKHKAMPYLRAVDEVRKAQPTVHINPGFEAQLALYRDMGCRLPGTRHEEVEEPPARVNSEATGTAMDNRGPASFRVDATYRWFLFACAVTNGDQGSLQRLPFLNGGGEGSRRAGSDSGGPALVREGCGGGGGGGAAAAAAAAATLRSRAAAYRCRACRAPLFSEANVVDHRHPVVQAASDSVYASFSRHGGDGSSWSAARDAAAAAAVGSASSLSSSSTFGARAPASKTSRGGKGAAAASRRVRGRGGDEIGGRVSTVGLASPAGGSGCCTSVFTEVLGWVEISEVCRGVACLGPREKFGKILCPGRKGRRGGAGVEAGTEALCQSKLGSWSLDGAACSCGRMVKPAFQFTLSRIERV